MKNERVDCLKKWLERPDRIAKRWTYKNGKQSKKPVNFKMK